MIKKELAPSIIHYTFPPRRETSYFGDAIVAIIDGNRALLIDVGYEDEAKQVIEDLSKSGITIDKIIISHFHADHLFGIHLLPDVPFYGGMKYRETLIFEGSSNEEIEKYTPNVAVDEPMIMTFGKHKLELIPFQGHSECTMLIKINDQFLYIADEIVLSTDGRLMLPYLCNGEKDIKRQRQLKAYTKLKDYSSFTIIPGHGPAFEGSKLEGYLRNLIIYLNAIIETDGRITYEEAMKKCDYPLLQSNWHEFNCK
ncbi:MAG: MBL fold metallo-hydrolase [Defluviitaleaceae bacterium]|nr:MBL fold metallo-hydrolase [Defluviitaleaceae bacterium]